MTRHHSCRVSPIRTSSDQRSVGSSPRHNAASHVLHRLPVPRHPPCALKHLQHKKTNSKKRNCTSIAHTNHQPPKGSRRLMRARCSQPLSTNQTPHPPTTKDGATTRLPPPHTGARETRACCLKAQQCVWQHQTTPPTKEGSPPSWMIACRAPDPPTHYRSTPPSLESQRAIQRIDQNSRTPPHDVGGPDSRGAP